MSMNATLVEQEKIYSLTSGLALFCIVDMLMLPYIRVLSCSAAMLLVVFWYFVNVREVALKREIYVAIIMIILSVVIGFVQTKAVSGLSVAFIIIFAFLVFSFLRNRLITEQFKKAVSVILFVYITFVFVLALLYIAKPSAFFSVRSFWTMSGTEITFTEMVINRYTFLYSDPNNAGCCFVAILAYVLFCEKHKTATYLYYICALVVSVVVTFSVQAVLALVIVVFAAVFTKSGATRQIRKIFIGMFAVAVVVFLLNFDRIMNSSVVKSLLFRVGNSNLSTGGGRMSFWKATIENALSWYNIFVGKGAVMDTAGKTYLPHSGHLYTTISFGLLTNIVFCKTFFLLPRGSKLKYYIILLPLFLIFTINTGVADYRFVCTLVLLSACVNATVEAEHDQRNEIASEGAEDKAVPG